MRNTYERIFLNGTGDWRSHHNTPSARPNDDKWLQKIRIPKNGSHDAARASHLRAITRMRKLFRRRRHILAQTARANHSVTINLQQTHHHPTLTMHPMKDACILMEFHNIYQIELDLPGIKADDFGIKFEDDGRILYLSGRFQRNLWWDQSQSAPCIFKRKFALEHQVDASKVTTYMKGNILVIVAPKCEEGFWQ